MKKVKVFMSQCHVDIDKEVNEFLVENKANLIDIKYNSTIAINNYNTVIEQYSALLVYEEEENGPKTYGLAQANAKNERSLSYKLREAESQNQASARDNTYDGPV